MTEEQITSTHPEFARVREALASVWDPKRPEHRLVYRVPFERAWLVDGVLQFELFAWDGRLRHRPRDRRSGDRAGQVQDRRWRSAEVESPIDRTAAMTAVLADFEQQYLDQLNATTTWTQEDQ
ncbi:hypothetical protein [Gordonia iterans]